MPRMTAEEVINIYTTLESIGVKICIDGGWSVDASLGKETREHADLDIAIEYRDLPKFREYLESEGYRELERAEDKKWNFVLGDDKGHEIDVHAFTFDENGHVVEGIEYPEGSLKGRGLINGCEVRCIDPTHMVEFHTRHEPTEKHYRDVTLLCEKFGISYPEQYARRRMEYEKLLKNDQYQVFLLACPASVPVHFAIHLWFVVNKKGTVSRFEVIHKKTIPKTHWGYLYKDVLAPWSGTLKFLFSQKLFWKKVKLLGFIEGGEYSTAKKMSEFIETSPETYPYKEIYSVLGPNSNTYAKWILDQFPEFPAKLPWNAIGKNFIA